MIFGAQQPPIDPRALARHILSQHRFALGTHAAVPPRTWWDVAMTWLGDRWVAFLSAFTTHVRLGKTAGVLAGDILLVAIAVFVLVVLFRLLSNTLADAAPALRAAPLPRTLRAHALYEKSLRAAAGGDYAAAIALLFRAALVCLDVRGVVHDRPSFTVNQTRRAVREHAAACIDAFEVLARIFTDALYAEHPVTADEWARARQAYAAIADEH
ncbi:MAG TPA: DUF4129 domain-containing protein [Candidatus Baltobacteraceae bacterium]|nr:DUF4129 domain-containing protein [Candidatus Baltobacteraceae bacterium]